MNERRRKILCETERPCGKEIKKETLDEIDKKKERLFEIEKRRENRCETGKRNAKEERIKIDEINANETDETIVNGTTEKGRSNVIEKKGKGENGLTVREGIDLRKDMIGEKEKCVPIESEMTVIEGLITGIVVER